MESKKVAVFYMPVLHAGYRAFVMECEKEGVEALYVISDDILASHEELDYINRKDRLRALPHEEVKQYLTHITTLPVFSLTIESIIALQHERAHFVMPREDINFFLAEVYFGGHGIEYKNVFLRRHTENVGESQEPVCEAIVLTEFEKTMMARATSEAEKSADWWRSVGAVVVKDGEVLAVSHNQHMPEEELPNIEGDARSLFKKGMNINYVTAAHAEVGALGECARKGISTEGAELFVTDFPCPYCARLVAKSGIKKVYFMHGYAVLGGDEFFKEMGIETVKVNISE